uniref:Uncharacterized protein n=1 Tax=Rhizophora mucronata TaxID=61149 RepID=A0A2P2QCY1_RHIMU
MQARRRSKSEVQGGNRNFATKATENAPPATPS